MQFDNYREGKKFAQDYINNFDETLPGVYAVTNTFARLPKKLDVQAMKLFGLILSKLDYKKDNRKNGVVEVECTLDEIIKACGVSRNIYAVKDYYRELASNLVRASYLEAFLSPTSEFLGYAIQQVILNDKNNATAFKFRLSDSLLPYFQELASHYTVVRLENAKHFRSRFSYELYLNLLSWATPSYEQKVDFRTYTTKQLKDIFGLDQNAYVSNGKFNRKLFEQKTLDLAISEINELTDLSVICTKIKEGRKVKAYCFEFWFL